MHSIHKCTLWHGSGYLFIILFAVNLPTLLKLTKFAVQNLFLMSLVKEKPTNSEEIDLKSVFHIFYRIYKKISAAFKSFFQSLSELFTSLFVFLRKRAIILVFTALAGFGIGFYADQVAGPSYYSELIMRTNFGSSRLLYNKIDYLNALISNSQANTLGDIFNITPADAAQLESFSIEPVVDEIAAAELYKNIFLDYRRNGSFIADTSWTKTISFEDFKKNLTRYDYPLHVVRLQTKNPVIFPKIQDGIIKLITEHPALNRSKNTIIGMLKAEEKILGRSLAGIDSLRQAYYQKIKAESLYQNQLSSTPLLLSQPSTRNPEIELYDKELMLKDELASIKNKELQQNDIIVVNSDFNDFGKKLSRLHSQAVKYSLYALLAALTLLILWEMVKNNFQFRREGSLSSPSPESSIG